MKDTKNSFVNNIERKLTLIYGVDMARKISDVIVDELYNFDITEKCTEVAIIDSRNEDLRKRYIACLLIEGKAKSTVSAYCKALDRFYDFINKNLDEVTTYDIRRYFGKLKINNVSNRTIESYRVYLNSFYSWLKKEFEIEDNPFDGLNKIKYQRNKKKPFNNIEVEKLRSACKNVRDRSIIETLLTTGLRVSELIDLKVSDFDFIKMSVDVRNGKGGKQRTVYTTDVAANYIMQHIQKNSYSSDDYIFQNTKRKSNLTTSGIRKILNSIAEDAGVKDVHPHKFRHTYASILADHGMNLQSVQILLGHSSSQTTQVYVHTREEQLYHTYKAAIA